MHCVTHWPILACNVTELVIVHVFVIVVENTANTVSRLNCIVKGQYIVICEFAYYTLRLLACAIKVVIVL